MSTTKSAVRTSEPGRAVAAGPDDDLEVVLAREADRGGDLLGARRSGDDRGPTIVDRVPEAARLVVARVLGRDHLGARSAQLFEVVGCYLSCCLDHPLPSLIPLVDSPDGRTSRTYTAMRLHAVTAAPVAAAMATAPTQTFSA